MVLAPQTTVTSELSVREGKGKYLTVFDGAEQKENQLMLKEENIHYIDNHCEKVIFTTFTSHKLHSALNFSEILILKQTMRLGDSLTHLGFFRTETSSCRHTELDAGAQPAEGGKDGESCCSDDAGSPGMNTKQ